MMAWSKRPLNGLPLYPLCRSGFWLLVAWLSAHVIADTAHLITGAPAPVTAIKPHAGAEQAPSVALALWSQAPQAPRQFQPVTRLPLTLKGIVQAPQLDQSLVILTTPEGQITAMTGDTLMPQVVLDNITAQGLILNNRGQQERLPWPETMTQTEPTP